jgi:hypothetical protein
MVGDVDSGLVEGSVVGILSPADCWSLEVGRLCELDLISGDFVIDVNIFFASLLELWFDEILYEEQHGST